MVVTDDFEVFVVSTFAALVIDVVFVDEADVVVCHCDLVVVLGFDVVTAYVVDFLDPCCCCISSCPVSTILAKIYETNFSVSVK